MNVQRLRKVQTLIREHPANADMAWWHRGINSETYLTTGEMLTRGEMIAKPWDCGTAHCIGGFTELAFPKVKLSPYRSYRSTADKAQEILDLSYIEVNALLYTCDWLPGWKEKYDNAKTQAQKGQIMADYIDAFIEHYAN